jgi:hypothetical protein
MALGPQILVRPCCDKLSSRIKVILATCRVGKYAIFCNEIIHAHPDERYQRLVQCFHKRFSGAITSDGGQLVVWRPAGPVDLKRSQARSYFAPLSRSATTRS